MNRSGVSAMVLLMEGNKTPILTKQEASELPVFSESLFASAFFTHSEILYDLGYQLIHDPGTLSAYNRKKLRTEIARPDFEVLPPEQSGQNNVIIEVTETIGNRALHHEAKQRQLRVMRDFEKRNSGNAWLLLPWEAITHPVWSLRLVRSLAEGRVDPMTVFDLLLKNSDNKSFFNNPLPL